MIISPCFVRSLVVHKGIIAMKPFIYETMYILRPDLGEEMTDQAIAKYQTILRDQGAENIETQHLASAVWLTKSASTETEYTFK